MTTEPCRDPDHQPGARIHITTSPVSSGRYLVETCRIDPDHTHHLALADPRTLPVALVRAAAAHLDGGPLVEQATHVVAAVLRTLADATDRGYWPTGLYQLADDTEHEYPT